MFHKGLNREIIIKTAVDLIEKDGYKNFSMRILADKLDVKTASLYKHVANIEDLFTEVGLFALKMQRDIQLDAIKGKYRDEAIFCLASGYRKFAKEHSELYKTIISMPMTKNKVLENAAKMVTEPIMYVLEQFHLNETQKMHYQRVMRGIMHGFISQEEAGYFSHFPVDIEESYNIAINCFLNELNKIMEEGE